ncbi:hypothetical protein AA313_de0202173 [Arthrobotrys entomopaga]|nr:hypothetical protein AA313_de0202173 [Arthrobotrys entomopaga]
MNTFRVLKTAVPDVAATTTTTTSTSTSISNARIGVLSLSKGFTLPTPNYITPTSRGVVPHISPDNLERNTSVAGVHVALEDFIEKAPQRTPPLYTYPSTLRNFISLPPQTFLLLSPRKSPAIHCPKPNSDSQISILTSVGFRDLPIKDYVSAVVKLHPDIVLGVADTPNAEKTVGKNRLGKIATRTEKWLDELLGRIDSSYNNNNNNNNKNNNDNDTGGIVEGGFKPAVFAPLLPLEKERQRLYLSYLVDNTPKLTGLVFPTAESLSVLPEELNHLARLQSDVSIGPHEVLEMVDMGVDIFNVSFASLATDAGIALHFKFGDDNNANNTKDGGEEEEEEEGGVLLEQLDLATDMWNERFATDLSPLEEGCGCYACQKHHRAFIRHCLSAKEMTAWVLLQVHNLWVLEAFFKGVRRSIEQGVWERDRERFGRRYKRALPERTGMGPRLRGYQYKSTGGDKKLNDPAYRSLNAQAPEEDDVPQVDSAELQKSGFAQVASDW